MFEFIHGLGKNKELEMIVQEIDSNIANNYKDAAQEFSVNRGSWKFDYPLGSV